MDGGNDRVLPGSMPAPFRYARDGRTSRRGWLGGRPDSARTGEARAAPLLVKLWRCTAYRPKASHLGSPLKPGGPVLTLDVSGRERSVACVRTAASPNEVQLAYNRTLPWPSSPRQARRLNEPSTSAPPGDLVDEQGYPLLRSRRRPVRMVAPTAARVGLPPIPGRDACARSRHGRTLTLVRRSCADARPLTGAACPARPSRLYGRWPGTRGVAPCLPVSGGSSPHHA